MYHYQECGLNNIYLKNGYHEIDTPYGKAVSITDAEGLNNAIAHHLITYKPKLTGSEFRFLRKHLELSQAKLAVLLSNSEQAIALWEKKSNIPKWACNMLRKLVSEHLGENQKLIEIIERFNDMDRFEYEDSLKFEESNHEWKQAA
ncbi:MAG: transcriptional regulator [Methylobacter sp.]|nr:transcriptional regulator [Methylobacter sp.]